MCKVCLQTAEFAPSSVNAASCRLGVLHEKQNAWPPSALRLSRARFLGGVKGGKKGGFTSDSSNTPLGRRTFLSVLSTRVLAFIPKAEVLRVFVLFYTRNTLNGFLEVSLARHCHDTLEENQLELFWKAGLRRVHGRLKPQAHEVSLSRLAACTLLMALIGVPAGRRSDSDNTIGTSTDRGTKKHTY